MEWFKSWFDSPYYNLLYDHRDHEEARSFIQQLGYELDLPPSSSALDVGCGNGRHAIYISELGYNVLGIDLSPSKIAEAKKFESEFLSFAQHDMRNPISEQSFDVIFNLFTSFGYFKNDAEHEHVIELFNQQLKVGGYFVFDFLNTHKAIENLPSQSTAAKNGVKFEISKRLEKNHIIKEIQVHKDNVTKHFCEEVRAFSRQELFMLFKRNGFDIVQEFGDYNLSPFELLHSERLILIAQKK